MQTRHALQKHLIATVVSNEDTELLPGDWAQPAGLRRLGKLTIM